jgi:glyoxylase-like metal-dependent hydrolase (beta-lactamase superfamily II)
MDKKIILIIVPIIVIFAGIFFFFYMALQSLNPIETGQILNTSIYTIKNGYTNVYLINTGDGYILIDAGSDARELETSLTEMNIGKNDIKWIFITHSDSDHIAGLTLFSNAEIFISEDELQLRRGIVGFMERNIFGRGKMPSGIDINKLTLLQDNQEFIFNGVRIKCIKTPGHTKGSMVYLIDNKYLFTGDVLKIENGKINLHPFTFFNRNIARRTIEKLTETINNSLIVLTSHFGLLNSN